MMEAPPPGIQEVKKMLPHRSELPVCKGKQADVECRLFTEAALRTVLQLGVTALLLYLAATT